jgi:hypothetical protein
VKFEVALAAMRHGKSITRDYGVWEKCGHHLKISDDKKTIWLCAVSAETGRMFIKGEWGMSPRDLLDETWEIFKEKEE